MCYVRNEKMTNFNQRTICDVRLNMLAHLSLLQHNVLLKHSLAMSGLLQHLQEGWRAFAIFNGYLWKN